MVPKADDLTSCASRASRMGIPLLTASRDAMPASICRAEAMGTMCGAIVEPLRVSTAEAPAELRPRQ